MRVFRANAWKMLRMTCLLGGVFLGVNVSSAHPVTFEGGTAYVSWNQPYMSEQWLGYSLSSRTAIAARWMRMDSVEDEVRNQYLAQVNHLLFRRGTQSSQANVYIYAGAGLEQTSDLDRSIQSGLNPQVVAGFEADWETRKHFALVRSEVMGGRNQTPFHRIEARLGVAPYEAKYDEMAAWLMLQVQSNPGLVRSTAVTPLVRLFYRTVLIESGVSFAGDWLVNFMVHF